MPRLTLFAMATAFAATNVLGQFVTPDGTCGQFFGYTCAGGAYGQCCNSATNKCGSDTDSCVNNCNTAFGNCGSNMMMSSPSYSSSMIVVGGVNGAALGPTAANSASNYAMPSASMASSMASPVYVIAPAPQSSSMTMLSPMMNMAPSQPSSMPSVPASMSMAGMVVMPSASMSMSMPPSPPPSGNPMPPMMDPEYNATVTVTSCNKTRTCTDCSKTKANMPTGAWNGTMPMTNPAMPTGTSGVCHKCMEGFTGAAAVQGLRISSVGLALGAALGFAMLLG